jgi:hypothetical protein
MEEVISAVLDNIKILERQVSLLKQQCLSNENRTTLLRQQSLANVGEIKALKEAYYAITD